MLCSLFPTTKVVTNQLSISTLSPTTDDATTSIQDMSMTANGARIPFSSLQADLWTGMLCTTRSDRRLSRKSMPQSSEPLLGLEMLEICSCTESTSFPSLWRSESFFLAIRFAEDKVNKFTEVVVDNRLFCGFCKPEGISVQRLFFCEFCGPSKQSSVYCRKPGKFRVA